MVTDTNMKQLENSKETHLSFCWQTFTVIYQPHVALQSLSMDNGISSAKRTVLLVIL
jgi:hypothetical protein